MRGPYQKTDIDELEASIDMEDWLDIEGLEYRITMGQSGEQINVKECPRCGGREYKVYLNRETGLGNCFHGSCVGEPGFTKFNFIKHYLGGGFKEALNHVKEYARSVGWRPKRTKTAAINNEVGEVKLPASKKLPIDGKNLKYLTNRGFSNELCEYFNLRYSHQGAYWYEHNGKKKCQDYSRRVIIPIYDLNGDLKTFQGRDINGDADRKYIFPPGLAGSGRHLFNGQNAVGCESIAIGEGAFDVMAIKNAFDHDPNLRAVEAVGTFGKSLSKADVEDSQIGALLKLKEKGLKRVTFIWDGELKTLIAASKEALALVSFGFEAFVAVLPFEKDPNEVPPQVVREAYYNAIKATKSSMIKLILETKRKYQLGV